MWYTQYHGIAVRRPTAQQVLLNSYAEIPIGNLESKHKLYEQSFSNLDILIGTYQSFPKILNTGLTYYYHQVVETLLEWACFGQDHYAVLIWQIFLEQLKVPGWLHIQIINGSKVTKLSSLSYISYVMDVSMLYHVIVVHYFEISDDLLYVRLDDEKFD